MPSESAIDDSATGIVDHRANFLMGYQNKRWAERYRQKLERLIQAETALNSEEVSKAAARSLFKLMSYKDEYEVARLHTNMGFHEKIAQQFEGDYSLQYHLAPPLLGGSKDHRGRPKKRAMTTGISTGFTLLTKLKWLRRTPMDPFGWTAERRQERQLIEWFDQLIKQCSENLNAENHSQWLEIMEAPMEIRGYGPVKEESANNVINLVDGMAAKLC
jgi:indolepyruvate ferredoxin oxidoreductase